MKKFLPLISTMFIALLILACNDDSPSIDHNLLTTSPWKRVRRMDLHIKNNKDTLSKWNSYITDSCNLNSYLYLNTDHSAAYDRNCDFMYSRKKVDGIWKLKSDEIIIHFEEYANSELWFVDTARITKLTSDSLIINWTRSRNSSVVPIFKSTTTIIQYFVH